MKRLYFLVPTIDIANSLIKGLQKFGVPKEDISLFGWDLAPITIPDIHKASVFERSDLLRALLRGIISGGIAGVTAGILVLAFPPAGLKLGWGIIVGLGLFGIGFGAWVSTLIGISIPSPELQQYEDAVEGGEFLMTLEIPPEKEQEINTLIRRYYPEVKISEKSFVK